MLKRLFLLLILLTSCQTWAAGLLVPDRRVQAIDLAPYLELLEDPTGQLDIAQVSSTEYSHHFEANTASVPDMGRTRSTWWARFQLHSGQAQEWYLLLDRPIGGSVEAFVSSQGAHSPLHRLDKFRLPAWHLPMKAGDNVTIYLRANNGQALLTLPLKLMDAETLLTSNSQEEILFAALFAGMLVLAVYNLLLFFSLREYSYLSLTLLLFASSLFFLRDTNLFPALTWLNDSNQYFYTTPLLLMFVTGFHYWRYINKGASRVIEYLCQWMPYLSVVAIPFMGLVYRGEQIIFGIALSMMPVFFVLTGLNVWHGHRASRIAYWALITLIIAAVPYSAAQVGWFTYDKPAVYFTASGFLLTALLLSFVQAEQTHLLREEKERMEATNQAKDNFLTTMSHELRTPAHAIVGFANLLQTAPPPAEQTVYLSKLLASTQHLQALVDDVLDLARINMQRLELESTPLELGDELHKIQQMFSLTAQQKGLTLTVTPLSRPLWVKGDPVRLRQVLVNLVGNAIKFTEHGSVKVVMQPQTATQTQAVQVYFEVADTGIGISPQQQQRLFQPFSQADSSTTRHYGGSGLGLAISHKLVNLMGGELEMASKPTHGSRFFFTLNFPLVTPETNAAPLSPLTNNNDLSGYRVLLVDDDILNCYLAELMLERLGVKATVVNSGQAALQQVEQQTFDLVMMDVSMPDMDGYTTTRHIRNAGHTQLPIIAVTAHAIEGERERCLAAGMNDYLTKPFDLATLHRALISNLMKSN